MWCFLMWFARCIGVPFFRAFWAAVARSSSNAPRLSFTIMSLGPVTLYAAMGRPHARASTMTMPKVSVRDGKTKTSAER